MRIMEEAKRLEGVPFNPGPKREFGFWAGAGMLMKEWWGPVVDPWIRFGDDLITGFKKAGEQIQWALGEIGWAIRHPADAADQVGKTLQGLWGAIKGAASDLWNDPGGTLSRAWDAFVTDLNQSWSRFRDHPGELIGEYAGYYLSGRALKEAFDWLRSFAPGRVGPSKWPGLPEAEEPAPAPQTGAALESANFAQKTYRQAFSPEGKFAGRTVSEVAADLRSGTLRPADVPIEYIVRDGNTLILNTRSAQALGQAGIPRSQWNAINMTGDAAAEARLTAQLQRNKLTSKGTPMVRPSRGN
jgi:hypothetical protein